MLSVFISLIYAASLLDVVSCSCQWGPWSKEMRCEWVDYTCLKGYHRNCLCSGKISMGSACNRGSNSPSNYIQTKPFVSIFYSAKGNCYKDNCPRLSNWCDWDAWSHWHPVNNISCHRHRQRKCCLTEPNVGYVSKKMPNFGCFLSTSVQNSTDFSEEISDMQCSRHTWWLSKALYVGIALGILIILCIICKFTGSKSNDKLQRKHSIIEIPVYKPIEPNQPSAPSLETDTPVAGQIQIPAPTRHETNYPNTPPSYDETIRTILATPDSTNENSHFPFVNEKKNFPDINENQPMRNGEAPTLNTDNIPPPSYVVYSRNPNLFHPT